MKRGPGVGAAFAALALLAGCEGYNVQLGTTASNLAGFHVVYEMPATSLRPWSERSSPVPIAAPPDGSSGASALPATDAALPPEPPANTPAPAR
jgi:hypothetical protein